MCHRFKWAKVNPEKSLVFTHFYKICVGLLWNFLLSHLFHTFSHFFSHLRFFTPFSRAAALFSQSLSQLNLFNHWHQISVLDESKINLQLFLIASIGKKPKAICTDNMTRCLLAGACKNPGIELSMGWFVTIPSQETSRQRPPVFFMYLTCLKTFKK